MPKGTKVDKVYEALRGKGYDKGKAARISQAETGDSLKTGKPAKKHAFGEDIEDPDYNPLDKKHQKHSGLPNDMGHEAHQTGAKALRQTLDRFRHPEMGEQ